MSKKDAKEYSDFSNVTKLENDLIPEEFPEGPVGSVINNNQPVSGKSTGWKDGQRRLSAFNYADKEEREGKIRNYLGTPPTHDE